jgi:hypothetical protein
MSMEHSAAVEESLEDPPEESADRRPDEEEEGRENTAAGQQGGPAKDKEETGLDDKEEVFKAPQEPPARGLDPPGPRELFEAATTKLALRMMEEEMFAPLPTQMVTRLSGLSSSHDVEDNPSGLPPSGFADEEEGSLHPQAQDDREEEESRDRGDGDMDVDYKGKGKADSYEEDEVGRDDAGPSDLSVLAAMMAESSEDYSQEF